MSMLKVRITGFTAIEIAERLGVTLCRTEGGDREGISPRGARLTAKLDPSSIFLELPAPGFRIDVGSGLVWLIHPEHGWIQMPSEYSVALVTAEDLVQDGALCRLSDRELRDLGQGFFQVLCSSGCDRAAGPCCDLCGDCRAAEASLGRACCVLSEGEPKMLTSEGNLMVRADGEVHVLWTVRSIPRIEGE